MELSSEDALRLNVLLANELEAVRIDESQMIVHALSPGGEAQVRLNPQGRDEQYLRKVRELLSSQVLGSPGGYPVFLRRWTRMGQARDNSLKPLLLLGEPEAVVAVVHASGLTEEIARRAWWAMMALGWVGEPLVDPIFSRTDSIGSVMRRKIIPVTEPIQQQFSQLRGKVKTQ